MLQRSGVPAGRVGGSGSGGGTNPARKQVAAVRAKASAGGGLEAGGRAAGAPVKRKREDFEGSELLDRLLNSAIVPPASGALMGIAWPCRMSMHALVWLPGWCLQGVAMRVRVTGRVEIVWVTEWHYACSGYIR